MTTLQIIISVASLILISISVWFAILSYQTRKRSNVQNLIAQFDDIQITEDWKVKIVLVGCEPGVINGKTGVEFQFLEMGDQANVSLPNRESAFFEFDLDEYERVVRKTLVKFEHLDIDIRHRGHSLFLTFGTADPTTVRKIIQMSLDGIAATRYADNIGDLRS